MFRTISARFAVGFLLIFTLAFLILNQSVKEVIRTSNQKIITDDLNGLKQNSSVYVRQAFLIRQYANGELYFGQMAEEMVSELRYATSSEVSAYATDGTLLSSSQPAAFAGQDDADLQQAMQGKTAYLITYDDDSGTVLFSYPVVMDGLEVGILRFSKDFSLLYGQSGRILDTIFYMALAIFAAVFLLSYLLSRHMTLPLAKLARASKAVRGGNLEVRAEIRRKDEIGRLAADFNGMIEQIGSQISTIASDRDRLKRMSEERKQFFDNVTHELKTPLTSILGYGEMIREKGETDRSLFDKGMTHIVEESRRLQGMVLNLLEMSSGGAGSEPFEVTDAGSMLRDVCESMAFRAQRYRKTLVCESGDGLWIEGQPRRLRQVLINLIDNAIKYSAPQAEIAAMAEAADGDVRLVVRNPGETIAPEQLDRWFQPFYMSDHGTPEAGSVGLGLSIVKAIVDDHGGTVRMVSADRMTRVEVTMPAYRTEGAL
ncbi:HAMP domain-containing histidine kinase [Paenibacillus sp. IB182496]|uniref:histidine kinase n=1 Tax=Paenibacillus sabuli TaxID=2772509 RepID=A0A927BYS5_9BACL|nr:HAMP domain-containing sensor histidine kinase [Paenibacillus sabuli]MBD2848080.1 HAMP domain-containing histidine kinase [Paenibacillus sabuli]